MEDSEALGQAKERFEAHIAKRAIIPADLRTPIYRAVLQLDCSDAYVNLMKIYRESDLSQEKERILQCLGFVKDVKKLQEVLEFSLSEEVKAQNSVFALHSVAHSYQGRLLTWEFFKNNFTTFIKRYEGTPLLMHILSPLRNFATEEKAKDMEEFFKTNPIPMFDKTIQQGLENIRLNILCLKLNINNIISFLKDKQKSLAC